LTAYTLDAAYVPGAGCRFNEEHNNDRPRRAGFEKPENATTFLERVDEFLR
jgi:hypothetical protein